MRRRTYAVVGNHIVKKIANKTIIDHLSITVEKRSIYAILGGNGAGKSVLLKCLMGKSKFDGGVLTISDDDGPGTSGSSGVSILGGGREVSAGQPPHIGFAPQIFHVSGLTRIYRLLEFVSAVNGLPKNRIVERYKAVAPMTGLPVSDHLVNQLRYSQKKCLSLVLAVIHEPELIILDDVTSGVDTVTLKNIWKLLSYVNKSTECTIIVTASNNFCYMETAVTHIGVLMNGKIVEEGTTTNLVEKYKASSVDDLLLGVVNAKDDQPKPTSERAGIFPSIQSPNTHTETSLPLNFISINETEAIERIENSVFLQIVILRSLILKNVWILSGIDLKMFYG